MIRGLRGLLVRNVSDFIVPCLLCPWWELILIHLGKMADNFGKMAIALAEIRDRLPPPTATNNPNP